LFTLSILYHFGRTFVCLGKKISSPVNSDKQEMTTRANPGGHHFVVLNVSINNKQVFVLSVVVSGARG